tara:strand:+ start:99 stop:545 length:447 start_codon:yes stop_codon:yes gene_type:complete
MSITFNSTALNWYTHTIVKDGTTVSSPTAVGSVYLNSTQVWGISNYSPETTLFDFTLAPDSNNLENGVSTIQSSYTAAFVSQGYTQGPGTDTTWTYVLRKGYRMVTSDGTFTGNDSTSNYLYEGHSVTGANTSHNGSTSVSLRRDNGV